MNDPNHEIESPADFGPSHPPSNVVPVQEYSWEWGNFPQPSPVTPGFTNQILAGDTPKHARSATLQVSERKPRSYPTKMSLNSFDSEETALGDNKLKRRSLGIPPIVIHDETASSSDDFGAGGQLQPSEEDSTTFQVTISGQTVQFELSLIPQDNRLESGSFTDLVRVDEVGASLEFDKGKVTFEQFMKDSSLVDHPHLVIRWVGDRSALWNNSNS